MPSIEQPDEPSDSAPGQAAGIPHVHYTTEGLPPAEQFAAWQARCLPVVEMTSARDPRDGYRAAATVWAIGPFALSRVRAEPASYRRTPEMIRQDGLDHWVVNMPLAGRHRFRSGGQETVLEPLVPHLFSLAHGFEGEREDIDWLALFVPRDAMPPRLGALDPATSGRIEGPLGALLADMLRRIAAGLPQMGTADAPRLEAMLAGLLEGCLMPPRMRPVAGKAGIEAARRTRALAIIRRELASPLLGPAEICKLAGMSRSQLYRCFGPLGGVARAIQTERLEQAHAALLAAAADADIGRTGERLGFPDASTFSRAFRRHFGYAPSQLAARAAAGAAKAAPPATTGLAAALAPPGSQARPGRAPREGRSKATT
jgi:AraC-like DNA-binding protein